MEIGSMILDLLKKNLQTVWYLHHQTLPVENHIMSSQFSHSVVFDSLWSHGLQHARIPCPSPTTRACSNSYSWSQWCHPTISSLVVPFSSYLQSFPSSGSFIMSWLFTSAGQITGASALALLPILNFFHLITFLQTLMSDYFWISCQLVSEK